MALKIVWTVKAEQQLDEVIDYLEEHWTEKEISNFFRRLEKGLKEIKNAPHRYKDSIRK
jgi:plasmid stabilization system protein ParE